MENYYPPEGFLKDEASGLYYQITMLTDENGRPIQRVLWFNAESGEFTQYDYPQENDVTETVVETVAEAMREATMETTRQVEQEFQGRQEFQTNPEDWVPNVPPDSVLLKTNQNSPSKKKYIVGIVLSVFILLGGTAGYFIATGKIPLFQKEENKKDVKTEAEKADASSPKESQEVISKEEKEKPSTEPKEEVPETTPETVPETTPETTPSIPEYDMDMDLYELTEEEIEAMNYIAAYGWQQIGEVGGRYEVTQEDLAFNDFDYDNYSVGSHIVETSTSLDGVLCEGIILNIGGTDSHSMYSNPHYFSIFMDFEFNIICTYEAFENYVVEAVATSELTDSYGTYQDDYATDQNMATAWGLDGTKTTEEYITLRLDQERTIYGVLVLNGYWKSNETYQNNGVITQFDIYAGDEWQNYSYGYKEDYISQQSNHMGYDVVNLFYKKVASDRVKIAATQVEGGQKYNDICVSEIMILAR